MLGPIAVTAEVGTSVGSRSFPIAIGLDAETQRETRRTWGCLLQAIGDVRDERAPARERTPTPAQ